MENDANTKDRSQSDLSRRDILKGAIAGAEVVGISADPTSAGAQAKNGQPKSKLRRDVFVAALAFLLVAFTGLNTASAQEKPSSEADIRKALYAGVPMGRWKEGLMFQGIAPQPWLKSAANWFPRSEDVQPNEMRIIFMGTRR